MARFQLITVALISSFCVLLLLPSAWSAKFDYCVKHPDYDVNVSGLDITPNPVRAGDPATFTIAASTDKPISGGKLVVEVSLFGLHIHSETHDICSETDCPISPGDFKISHSEELPGITPPGSYKLKMIMKDDKDKQLTCISFTLRIQWAADAVAES